MPNQLLSMTQVCLCRKNLDRITCRVREIFKASSPNMPSAPKTTKYKPTRDIFGLQNQARSTSILSKPSNNATPPHSQACSCDNNIPRLILLRQKNVHYNVLMHVHLQSFGGSSISDGGLLTLIGRAHRRGCSMGGVKAKRASVCVGECNEGTGNPI
jgi:hypothetical protein